MKSRFVIILTLMCLAVCTSILGQEVDSKKLDSSLSVNGIQDVNIFNGKVSVKIPLVNIKGRGEINLPLYFNTSSKQVTELGRYWLVNPGTGSGEYVTSATIESSKVNHQPVEIMPGGMSKVISSPDKSPNSSWMTKLIFEGADGSHFELFDNQANSSFNHSVYHKYKNENGNLVLRPRGRYFSTRDGSDIRFVSDAVIYDHQGSGTPPPESHYLYGYLNFPNGDVYRIDQGFITWMKDRNGNKITIDYQFQPGGGVTGYTITDSIGRKTFVTLLLENNISFTQVKYNGVNGVSREIKIIHGSQSSGHSDWVGAPFPPENLSEFGITSKGLILPDGRSYNFFYNAEGLLTKMETPTGGKIEYDHAGINFQNVAFGPDETYTLFTRITEKRIYDNDQLVSKTTYSFPETPVRDRCSGNDFNRVDTEGFVQVRNYSPTILLSSSKHYFAKWSHPITCEYRDSMLGAFGVGQEVKTEMLDQNNNVIKIIEKKWENRESTTWWQTPLPIYHGSNSVLNVTIPTPTTAPPLDPRVSEETLTLVDSNQVSKKTYQYDGSVKYNLLTDIYEYEYGVGSSVEFKRRTHTDYIKNNNNYTSNTGAQLRKLPTQKWVSSDINGNNKISLVKFEYDIYSGTNHSELTNRSDVIGHDTANYGQNNIFRGNVTATRTYVDAANETGEIAIFSHYDILGNVVATIDARGYQSNIFYDDNFGISDGEAKTNTVPNELGATIEHPEGWKTYAFPRSSSNTLNWIMGYLQVDYYTGKPVDAEDLNGIRSSTFYNDLLDRPTKTITAIGTAHEAQSNVIYYDAQNRIETKSDLFTLNDNKIKSETFSDGLGRTVKTQSYDANGTITVVKSVPFIMVQDPETSIWRAGSKTTNPYRPSLGETEVWTTTLTDSLGRTIKTITEDGSISKTEYAGNTITITDQSGRKRRSVINALGQNIRTDEPNEAGQLDVAGVPVQSTSYTYDILNNLKTVTQGIQTRTFVYDSLSRLTQVTNPEMGTNSANGTITYQYDNNGNLTKETDARNIETDYGYDAINRIIHKNHSDATPDVNYTYENINITDLKNVLTKVTNGFSITEYQAFDEIGRILQSRQTTDGTAYNPMTYKYNLSGALTEQVYPSGRIVKSNLDNNGDLESVQSARTVNGSLKTYANNFTYTTVGAVSSMRLGNGNWESTEFNSRLQTEQIGLGTSLNQTNLLKLEYSYGTTANNGNVQSQTITVPTIGVSQGFSSVQTYSYDSLNRIKDAKENINGNPTPEWKQTFIYDRYGNRNFDEANTTTLPKQCINQTVVCDSDRKILNPAISPGKNRIVQDQDNDQSDDYLFDNAGNMTKDPSGRTFIYNADNKQIEVRDSLNQIVGQYFYNGDGNRVKKYVPSTGEITIFVYDALGKMVAEYSTIIASTSQAKVLYPVTDTLDSPRIITDASGNVTARHDYQPFGEEVARLNYGVESIRNKYTGYEKDSETQMDYAQARYYNNKHGRFTSIDPFNASANTANPQSFNRYVYVKNDPVNYNDPSGLAECAAEFSYDQCGGDAQARGGNFGDEYATFYDLRNLSMDTSTSLLKHEYRVNNAFYGIKGDDGGGTEFPIWWGEDLTGNLWTYFSINVHAGLPFELRFYEKGEWKKVGERLDALANGVTGGLPDLIDNLMGRDKAVDNTSAEYAEVENSGTALGVFLPLPGGKIGALEKAVQKLGLVVKTGSKGVAVGSGRNAAVKLFNELRGSNAVIRREAGLYTAKSATGNGTVTFRFPSKSESKMWSVDTPGYIGEGIKKFHF